MEDRTNIEKIENISKENNLHLEPEVDVQPTLFYVKAIPVNS